MIQSFPKILLKKKFRKTSKTDSFEMWTSKFKNVSSLASNSRLTLFIDRSYFRWSILCGWDLLCILVHSYDGMWNHNLKNTADFLRTHIFANKVSRLKLRNISTDIILSYYFLFAIFLHHFMFHISVWRIVLTFEYSVLEEHTYL